MTREEAIKRLKTMQWPYATNHCPDRTALDIAIDALRKQKTVKWVEKDDALYTGEKGCICSNCGFVTAMQAFYKYCPNCGGKIKKVGAEE